MASFPEESEIDFLILADKAEVLNSKLYMMGGGWDRRYISNLEAQAEISIALGLLVPWHKANAEHDLVISIQDGDGVVILPEVRGKVTVGRPAHAEQGQSFRVMSVITHRWKLPDYGPYTVVATLGGRVARSCTFHALQPTGRPSSST